MLCKQVFVRRNAGQLIQPPFAILLKCNSVRESGLLLLCDAVSNSKYTIEALVAHVKPKVSKF